MLNRASYNITSENEQSNNDRNAQQVDQQIIDGNRKSSAFSISSPENDPQPSPFKRDSNASRGSIASIRRVTLSDTKDKENSREQWSSKWEFLLSCVGLSVGIGNVWRFPYLAYENGGGAFLIPYLIMLFLAGKPMYFMELAFGQFAGTGPLTIWKCAPIAKGIGVSMVLVAIVVAVYYNVVMAYTLYFIAQSFQSELPWTRCDPEWATGTNCTVREKNATFSNYTKSSSQIFWERKVLNISSGIEEVGEIKWDLALCLLISWTIVILCLVKGVKSSGKVVYFAATFPYVILISLLVAGLLQEGAWDGVKYFITPDWEKLLSIKVWRAAAGQMFYSLGVSMGGLIMYSSYNDFRHNIFQDAMVVSVLDTITSIISGLVIFSVLGSMAHDLGPNVSVSDVVKSGPGLAFVTYPEALAKLPWPQMWSVLFFLMLFILGLDSEFAILETVLTSLADEIVFVKRHKLKFCIGTGVICFTAGLSCVTRGGQYIFDILDTYGGSYTLLFIAVAECVGIMWIYGYDRFAFDIRYMLGRELGWYWLFTWKYTAPVILAFIFIYSLVDYHPLKYGEYDYPTWADIVGCCLTFFICMQVPLWALFAVFTQKKGENLKEKFQLACQDTDDWGPREGIIRTDWRRSHMEHKNFKSNSVILKNANCNSTYEIEENVYENIRFRSRDSKICVDNPAFIPDESEK